jgi:hypothetical protein
MPISPVMAPLDRHIKILISRGCFFASAENNSRKLQNLLMAGHLVCGSVDNDAQALTVCERVCQHGGGKHWFAVPKAPPNNADLERISAEVEKVYQELPKENPTGAIVTKA